MKNNKYLPLILVFAIILSISLGMQYFLYTGQNFELRLSNWATDFMAIFFIIFGTLKAINLNLFVEAFSMYDLVAKRFIAYAYMYPFIELALGFAYLFRFMPDLTNLITIILMLLGSIGIAIELYRGREIECACLGAIFRLPLTYVSLFENILMALMAGLMLIF